jgi:hypothetical protein
MGKRKKMNDFNTYSLVQSAINMAEKYNLILKWKTDGWEIEKWLTESVNRLLIEKEEQKMEAKHNAIQFNGVCWECGKPGAQPVASVNLITKNISTIGWQCSCGRWWPVLVDDLDNWVRARKVTKK